MHHAKHSTLCIVAKRKKEDNKNVLIELSKMRLYNSRILQTVRLNTENVVQIAPQQFGATQNVNTNLLDCILDIQQITLLNTKTTLDVFQGRFLMGFCCSARYQHFFGFAGKIDCRIKIIFISY